MAEAQGESNWCARIAALSPWEQAMDYSNACFFCQAELGDDMDESKVTHAADCLWQNANDALRKVGEEGDPHHG
jgi:hypothetical protein